MTIKLDASAGWLSGLSDEAKSITHSLPLPTTSKLHLHSLTHSLATRFSQTTLFAISASVYHYHHLTFPFIRVDAYPILFLLQLRSLCCLRTTAAPNPLIPDPPHYQSLIAAISTSLAYLVLLSSEQLLSHISLARTATLTVRPGMAVPNH